MGMVTARYNRGNNANSTTQSKAATAGRTVTREMTLRWRCGTCLSARKRERVSGVLLSATVRVGFSVENDSRVGGLVGLELGLLGQMSWAELDSFFLYSKLFFF